MSTYSHIFWNPRMCNKSDFRYSLLLPPPPLPSPRPLHMHISCISVLLNRQCVQLHNVPQLSIALFEKIGMYISYTCEDFWPTRPLLCTYKVISRVRFPLMEVSSGSRSVYTGVDVRATRRSRCVYTEVEVRATRGSTCVYTGVEVRAVCKVLSSLKTPFPLNVAGTNHIQYNASHSSSIYKATSTVVRTKLTTFH